MNFRSWLDMRLGLLTHPQFYRNPIGAIARRLLWKSIWSRRKLIRFRTQYGFIVEGSPLDIGMGSLFYRGRYEWGELVLWRSLMDKTTLTVFDIGANIGIYSLVAAELCRKRGVVGVRIFGFEPNPVECAKFRRNVTINNYHTVQVEQLAVSDTAGSCRMALPPSGLGVFGHLLKAGDPRSTRDQEVDVRTVDLDSWCANLGLQQIDLMKLDVEGHELQVLAGAGRLLARHAIGALLMEVGHGEWRRCIDMLKTRGYSVHAIGPRGGLEAFDEERVGGWCNVLALAPNAGMPKR